MPSDYEIGVVIKAASNTRTIFGGSQKDLDSFARGLAGVSGLMPGVTLQSFALRNAIDALGSSAGLAGIAVGGVAGGLLLFGGAVKDVGTAAADFDYQMTIIRNNTTMTDADFRGMTSTVVDLASQTGAAMTDIADGYRHASNLGYDFAASQKIVAAGTELAVATGARVGDTTNRLAGIMKEFGGSADQASRYENTMFLEAAQGNLTFQQLADYSGRLNAVTGALKGQFTDQAAALDALTRHGFDAAQAQTQLLGIMTHIVAPTSAAEKELKRLSQTTGVDLVGDFSLAGLQTKGLSGIFDDLRQAIGGNEAEMFRLVPAFRGGQGAIALLTTATDDWKESLNNLDETMSGEATPAAEALQREMETTEGKARILGQRFDALKISLGSGISDGAGVGISALLGLGDAFSGLGGRIASVMGTQVAGGFTVGDLIRDIGMPGGAVAGGIEAIRNKLGGGEAVGSTTGGDFSPGAPDESSHMLNGPGSQFYNYSTPLTDAQLKAAYAAAKAAYAHPMQGEHNLTTQPYVPLQGEAGFGANETGRGRGGGGGGGAGGASAALGVGDTTRALQDQRDAAKAASDMIGLTYSPKLHELNGTLHDQQGSLRDLEAEQRRIEAEERHATEAVTAHGKARTAAIDQIHAQYTPALDEVRGKIMDEQDALSSTRDAIDNLRDGRARATDALRASTIPTIDTLLEKLDLQKDQLQQVRDEILNQHIPALQALKAVGLDPNTQAAKDFAAALEAIPKDVTVDVNTVFSSSGGPGGGGGGGGGGGVPSLASGAYAGQFFAPNPENKGFFDPVTHQPSDMPAGGHGANIPAFAGGGLVPGPLGAATLAVVHGGERVLTPGQQAGGGTTLQIVLQGNTLLGDSQILAYKIAQAISPEIDRYKGRQIAMVA